MRKALIIGLLLLTSVKGWAAIARDINITVKKSNSTSAVTPSTSAASANELFLVIGAQNTSTPNIPTTTATNLTFASVTVLTNGGSVAAWVACSSTSVTSKTFTWNSAAASGIAFQLMSFTGTGCSPANPLGGIGNTGTSIAADATGVTLVSQYTSSVANSYGVGVGVDASNGDTLTTDVANESFALTYTTDAFSAWSGWVTVQNATTSVAGTVVKSSATGVTSFGSSMASLSVEIIPTSSPAVTTNRLTNITNTSAQGNGIAYSGGSNLTDSGECYSTSANPTTSDTCVSNGTTEGSFSVSFTGLSAGTIYHARAYGTNALGTTYGLDAWFQTTVTHNINTNTGSGNVSTLSGSGNITAQ